MNRSAKNLNKIRSDAILLAEKEINRLQEEILNPWFEKKGISFKAGMGTWSMEDKHGLLNEWSGRTVPKKIMDILEIQHPCYDNQSVLS